MSGKNVMEYIYIPTTEWYMLHSHFKIPNANENTSTNSKNL